MRACALVPSLEWSTARTMRLLVAPNDRLTSDSARLASDDPSTGSMAAAEHTKAS